MTDTEIRYTRQAPSIAAALALVVFAVLIGIAAAVLTSCTLVMPAIMAGACNDDWRFQHPCVTHPSGPRHGEITNDQQTEESHVALPVHRDHPQEAD